MMTGLYFLSASLTLTLVFSSLGCSGLTKKSEASGASKSSSGYTGLGLSSVAEKDLKNYAAPAIPMKTKDELKKFFSLRTPGAGILHPNGQELYFSWSITGENQVWKLVGPNSFPIQMTTGQNPTFLKQITPNGQFLILEKDTDGQENPGLFLQPTKGGELTLIFQKPNVRASFNFISQDGKSLYFTANDLKPDTMTIYRYDMDEKKITKVSDRNGVWAVADQFQEQLLLVKMTGSTGREYYELNTKTDELSPLLGQNEYTTYQVSYTKTPGTFFVMTNKFTDLQRLYLYKKNTPKTKKEIWKLFANQPEDEIEEFNVSPKKDRLMILYNQKGYFKPKVYNVNGQLISMPKFDSGETVVPGDFDWTGKKISLSSSSSKSPRKNVIYNFETQKSQVWNFGSTPQIDSATFSEEILEYYTAQDGTKIPMFVMRPKSCINQLCPVIVQFHGGPEAQSMAGFSGYKQSFAAAGFVFVSPNVRGSTGYGKAWLDSDNGPLRLKVITDIEDCAKHIRSQWKINGVSPRVGVMGGSYGGYSTLMAMSKFAGAYDAGVASVGMSDLRSFLINTAPYRRILRITEYGDPEKDAEALKQLSPITYVDQIKDPLLIIQGANDPRVPVGEAIQIKRVLDQKQIAARLIIFADEGHGSAKLENQILEVGNTVEFFKLHLAEKSTEKVQ